MKISLIFGLLVVPKFQGNNSERKICYWLENQPLVEVIENQTV
jgi:hypothetical protein